MRGIKFSSVLVFVFIGLPTCLPITTTHHDRPDQIRLTKTSRRQNLTTVERQKRLLPYVDFYLGNNYNRSPGQDHEYPDNRPIFRVVVPKGRPPGGAQVYYKQSQEHNDPKYTPFLETNALPGPFLPIQNGNHGGNKAPSLTVSSPAPQVQIVKTPNYSEIYDKLSQLKLAHQHQPIRNPQLHRYRTPNRFNAPPVEQKPNVNYVIRTSQHPSEVKNEDDSHNTVVHTYKPTEIDITSPYVEEDNRQNYEKNRDYYYPSDPPKQSFLPQSEITHGSKYPEKPTRRPLFLIKNGDKYVQFNPQSPQLQRPIFIETKPQRQRPLTIVNEKFIATKFVPKYQVEYDQELPQTYKNQDVYRRQKPAFIKVVPLSPPHESNSYVQNDYHEQRYQKPYEDKVRFIPKDSGSNYQDHRYQNPHEDEGQKFISVPHERVRFVPKVTTIDYQEPNYEPPVQTEISTTTESNNLHEILKKLQDSNTLPQTLTPDNIDNSIKTLVRILNNLRIKQKGTVQPVSQHDISGDYIEAENEAGVGASGQPEEIPGTITQHFPDDTPDGGTPGKPGVDYPALSNIPPTSFNCKTQRYKGFFGDPDTNCQVWHYCDLNGGQASFLCPNGTIFSQVALTCDWWYNVKCSTTAQLYVLNERLYKYILPLSPKFPEDYSGPLVDKYLALKFQEMEEKMKKERKGKVTHVETDKEKPETLQTIEDDNDDAVAPEGTTITADDTETEIRTETEETISK